MRRALLGYAELFRNNYRAAREHLTDAVQQLQRLSTPRVPQPLQAKLAETLRKIEAQFGH